jgi:hypothetical protein
VGIGEGLGGYGGGSQTSEGGEEENSFHDADVAPRVGR